MNWYIVLAAFLLGIITGFVVGWFLVRGRISSKEIHIGKNKVKGRGNKQDVDAEFEEAEQLTNRQQRKKDKELQAEAEKNMNEVKNLLKEKS